MTGNLIFLIILGSPALFLILHYFKPRVIYYWFLAIGIASGLLASVTYLSSFTWSLAAPIIENKIVFGFPEIVFVLDDSARVITITIATVIFSGCLLLAGDSHRISWKRWLFYFMFGVLGIVSALAGNLATLVLLWGIIDVFTAVAFLLVQRGQNGNEPLFWSLFLRSIGSLIALYTVTIGGASIGKLVQTDGVYVLLLLACGFRLIHPVFVEAMNAHQPEKMLSGFLLTIVNISSLVILLGWFPKVEMSSQVLSLGLLVGIGFVGILYAYRWYSGRYSLTEQLEAWVIGMMTLVGLAAIEGQGGAVLLWGATLMLGGVLIFFRKVGSQIRFAFVFPAIGMFFAANVSLYINFALIFENYWVVLFYWIIQALLIGGMLWKISDPGVELPAAVPGVILLRLGGLMALLITFGMVTFRFYDSLHFTWWGFLSPGFGLLLAVLGRNLPSPTGFQMSSRFAGMLPLQIFSRLFWRIYQAPGMLVNYSAVILEGSGGILWALLLLILLLSILSQVGVQGY